jgi:hypothetical protein
VDPIKYVRNGEWSVSLHRCRLPPEIEMPPTSPVRARFAMPSPMVWLLRALIATGVALVIVMHAAPAEARDVASMRAIDGDTAVLSAAPRPLV